MAPRVRDVLDQTIKQFEQIKGAIARGEEVVIGKVHSDGGGFEHLILECGLEGSLSPDVNLIKDTDY